MTLEEVANYLLVTKKTIYRLLERHRIPAVRVGHQWRFDEASIDDWLRQNSTETVADVLVIDNDQTICDLFQDTLQINGHTVTTASDSFKGLELAENNDYDLVFLDLKMPGIDGAELYRRIKIVKPELPVTIITGYPDSDLMMKVLTYGPFGIMKKPFAGSDILAALNTYLRFSVTNR